MLSGTIITFFLQIFLCFTFCDLVDLTISPLTPLILKLVFKLPQGASNPVRPSTKPFGTLLTNTEPKKESRQGGMVIKSNRPEYFPLFVETLIDRSSRPFDIVAIGSKECFIGIKYILLSILKSYVDNIRLYLKKDIGMTS